MASRWDQTFFINFWVYKFLFSLIHSRKATSATSILSTVGFGVVFVVCFCCLFVVVVVVVVLEGGGGTSFLPKPHLPPPAVSEAHRKFRKILILSGQVSVVSFEGS